MVRLTGEHAASRRSGRWLLAACLAATAASWLWFLSVAGERPVYARTVADVLAEGAALSGRALRVSGTLVPGSLDWTRCPGTFRLSSPGAASSLLVRYAACEARPMVCDVPGYENQLIARGRLAAGAALVFDADDVLARCPGKYERHADPCAKMPAELRARCAFCGHTGPRT